MAPVVNDKPRFISSITDIITLFCRLALKYDHKFKIDGCLAVTIDDDKTLVVNLSQTIEGHNTNVIYPSLRVNGRDGQTYVLLKDKPAPVRTNTPAANTSTVLSQQASAVIAGPSSTRCQVVKSAGSAHLLITPQTPGKPRTAPIIIVSPKKQTTSQCMKSLITGRLITTTVTASEAAPSVSTTELSNMGTRNNKVLQTRVLPEIHQVTEVKTEPAGDPAYEQSRDLSTQIIQIFRSELAGDKENSSTGGGSRRSSTDCSAAKRRRTNSSAAVPVAADSRNSRLHTAAAQSPTKSDSPRRKSSRLHASSSVSTEGVVEKSLQESAVLSTPSSPLPSAASEGVADMTDEESEDDALSTATSEEEVEELYRCSEKFTAEVASKMKELDAMRTSLNKKMKDIGKEGTKDIKTKFTRSVNAYNRTAQAFELARSKGCSDIKATESKLEKDLVVVEDGLRKVTEMLYTLHSKDKPQPGNKSSKESKPKPTSTSSKPKPTSTSYKPKPTSSGVKHTKKVVKKLQAQAMAAESRSRIVRACGECAPCKREADCGKCRFCQDKVKFGGENKLRQKCLKKQCLNKGSFTLKGKCIDRTDKAR